MLCNLVWLNHTYIREKEKNTSKPRTVSNRGKYHREITVPLPLLSVSTSEFEKPHIEAKTYIKGNGVNNASSSLLQHPYL